MGEVILKKYPKMTKKLKIINTGQYHKLSLQNINLICSILRCPFINFQTLNA